MGREQKGIGAVKLGAFSEALRVWEPRLRSHKALGSMGKGD